MSGCTESLCLALCSGITPDRIWGPYVPGIKPKSTYVL